MRKYKKRKLVKENHMEPIFGPDPSDTITFGGLNPKGAKKEPAVDDISMVATVTDSDKAKKVSVKSAYFDSPLKVKKSKNVALNEDDEDTIQVTKDFFKELFKDALGQNIPTSLVDNIANTLAQMGGIITSDRSDEFMELLKNDVMNDNDEDYLDDYETAEDEEEYNYDNTEATDFEDEMPEEGEEGEEEQLEENDEDLDSLMESADFKKMRRLAGLE